MNLLYNIDSANNYKSKLTNKTNDHELFTTISSKYNGRNLNFHVVTSKDDKEYALKIFNDICNKLNLPKKINISAYHLLENSGFNFRMKKYLVKYAGFVFLACRRLGIPRTYAQFCAGIKGLKKRELYKSIKMIRVNDIKNKNKKQENTDKFNLNSRSLKKVSNLLCLRRTHKLNLLKIGNKVKIDATNSKNKNISDNIKNINAFILILIFRFLNLKDIRNTYSIRIRKNIKKVFSSKKKKNFFNCMIKMNNLFNTIDFNP